MALLRRRTISALLRSWCREAVCLISSTLSPSSNPRLSSSSDKVERERERVCVCVCVCSLSTECFLLVQNVFSSCRMCSLSLCRSVQGNGISAFNGRHTVCVLLLQNVFSYHRMCSLSLCRSVQGNDIFAFNGRHTPRPQTGQFAHVRRAGTCSVLRGHIW